MKKLIIIFIPILLFSKIIFGEQPQAKIPNVHSMAYISKNNNGIVEYHTLSERYKFVRIPAIDPLTVFLLLEEITESLRLGDEISKSSISLTLWKVIDESKGDKIWEIENIGHRWEIKDEKLIITVQGCCENPDKKYYFNVVTGKKN